MLNLTEISQRIAQPSLCSINEIDDLKNLCVTYPYSQVFPLLYLSTLARHNDVRFDNELERLAYSISDRAMLYTLINTSYDNQVAAIQETSKKIQEDQETVQETKIEDIVEENSIEDSIEKTLEEELPINDIEEIVEDIIKPELTEIKEELKIESEIIIETVEESVQEEIVEDKNKKSFEDLLTAQTIAASYSLEKEEQRLKEVEELKKQLEQPIIPSEFIEPIAIESKKSFSSWLTANENYEQPIEEKVNVDDLISKFIEDSPKIKPAQEKLFEGRKERKEFFSPTKKAKESLDEQQLPVSETLAKIFAAQGNFPKAIYAYEQLMLIIPEKKIFFADQIKELQKKLNN